MAGTEKNNLREQVAMLPQSPGVYQFVDRSGTIIYVGKAKSLRKRVSSYFVQSKEHSPKVRVLVKQIAEIRQGVEVLVATPAVRNLIREGKTPQLHSIIQTGSKNGMQAMDLSLRDMVLRREVTYEEALMRAIDVDLLQRLLNR